MKTKIDKAHGSKAVRRLFILALALPLAFASCKKDENVSNDVTTEEAAEVMIQAVDPASGGLVMQTENAAEVSVTASAAECGSVKDTVVHRDYSTTNRSYSYTLNWQNSLNCLSGEPSQFAMSFNGESAYSGPRMSSNDSSVGEFVVSGIQETSPVVTMSQTYTREGTQQSKVRKTRTFTTTTTITTSNLTVDKATKKILSGTASVTVEGTVSTGGSFSRNGTITFLGDGKAKLEVSGGSYTIQW